MHEAYQHKKEVFQAVREEILEFLENALDSRLLYHGLEHTLSVEEAVLYYSKAENLDEDQIINLRYAAIFHDSGYLKSYHRNEEFGAKLMMEYLNKYKIDVDSILSIQKIILATQHGHKPENISEEIICDADHDYLGTPNYIVNARNLYEEMISFGDDISENQWLINQIDYLKNHHRYYTKTAIERRLKRKKEWIKYLESQVEK